jgi:hypothetical protein
VHAEQNGREALEPRKEIFTFGVARPSWTDGGLRDTYLAKGEPLNRKHRRSFCVDIRSDI